MALSCIMDFWDALTAPKNPSTSYQRTIDREQRSLYSWYSASRSLNDSEASGPSSSKYEDRSSKAPASSASSGKSHSGTSVATVKSSDDVNGHITATTNQKDLHVKRDTIIVNKQRFAGNRDIHFHKTLTVERTGFFIAERDAYFSLEHAVEVKGGLEIERDAFFAYFVNVRGSGWIKVACRADFPCPVKIEDNARIEIKGTGTFRSVDNSGRITADSAWFNNTVDVDGKGVIEIGREAKFIEQVDVAESGCIIIGTPSDVLRVVARFGDLVYVSGQSGIIEIHGNVVFDHPVTVKDRGRILVHGNATFKLTPSEETLSRIEVSGDTELGRPPPRQPC